MVTSDQSQRLERVGAGADDDAVCVEVPPGDIVCSESPLSRWELVKEGIQSKLTWIMVPVAFLIVVGVWEAIVQAGLVAAIILPAPSAIFKQFFYLIGSDFFLGHLGTTLYETVVGFAIAAVLGLFLGTLIAEFVLMRATLYPYIVAFQVLPKAALAPLFITWFGFGAFSKLAMATAISFFAITLNTMVGLQSYEEDAFLLMRSLRATRWQTFIKLKVPTALPFIFAGLKNGITLALIGAVIGEFVAARSGLGLLVETYNFQMKIPLVFATIIVLSLVGLALYGIMELIDRKVVFWRKDWQQEIL
jgi:NitT/TauT family transport system permease protein